MRQIGRRIREEDIHMNQYSYLCRFIADHKDWEVILTEEYGLIIKKDGSLALFKYSLECDFADPVVQEARGIIIDTEKCEVV